ncbi:uncharacterized protein LOC127246954 [Andrographis paniculata]|uniref:uncharacterized protein LOC127246954 n=1 Tax=Andrographis paniculata TaxID=175694 RepID=UPI0021E7DFA4|nr:uncharacterized protein LOC127246954 [Andrographis paniculata]
MPPNIPATTVLARLGVRGTLLRRRIPNHSHYSQIRRFGSIAGANLYSSENHIVGRGYGRYSYNLCDYGNVTSSSIAFQKRCFLGCGDGAEGNMLSKVHEERLVLGYSPEQLFDVVAAVDMYEEFLPWCQRSEIVRRFPDGGFDAELEIGFKFLVESYISNVKLNKPKSIKTTSSQSTLFDHLINIWEFNPGPAPGTSNVYFLVDFKFKSPLYRQVANMFFTEVVSRLVTSFTDRCRLIYGPGVQILENTKR